MTTITTTLEQIHNDSTVIETSSAGGFNSVGQVNGSWYLAVSPAMYDTSNDASAIGEYCVRDSDNYCVFMNLARESADDTLYLYITRYRISDGFLDLTSFVGGGYTTTVTSVKYNSGHIYITHVDTGSYWYEDYNISLNTKTNNSGQYTGAGTEIGNTPIPLNGYNMSSALNVSTIGGNKYQKNHIRMTKIIE